MKDPFLIVDGNSLIHRAFHALPLMDAEGVYTNAIYGFLSMLIKVVREENIRYLAVCFDEHGPTFRHTVYPDYKAGRAPTAPELKQQFETVMPLLDAMGIRRFSLRGWEADDLLGTLSLKGRDLGLRPILLTGDRDALQLVDEDVTLMFTRKGISETILFTPDKVREEYGFPPERVTDWKGLAGDSSDNIPGIPGVGDKTAVKLLAEYDDLENILANAGNIKGKLGEKIAAGAEQARFCKELATIRRDAPVELIPEECEIGDWTRGLDALKKLKLFSIIKRMAPEEGEAADAAEAKPMTLLPMRPPEDVQTGAELRAWLEAADAPVCLLVGETSLSLATEKGDRAEITLGGNLLLPGMDPREALEILSEFMTKRPACVHDGKKLLHLLNNQKISLPGSFAWDTMLAAYLLDPQRKSYAAADLLEGFPTDAGSLCSLWARQRNEVEKAGMTSLMTEVEIPLSLALFRMEREGMAVDPAFLRELGARYTEEIKACREEVIRAAGVEFNLNSPQQLGEILFEKMGLPHGKKTGKGYSTSAEVLEGLRFDAPEIIEPLLRYRKLTKLNSTYVEGLLPLADRENRIHSRFDQVATATGRLSSSEPNLQNIPVRTEEGREIRRAFIPREGWVLVDADYSQIELRLMAHFSDDPVLIEAFRNGEDIHARTAGEIFDVPPEWVTPELRSRAKAVNFGLIYGISGFGLSRNTGVSRKEAAEFIEKYFGKYPGVKRYMDGAAADGIRDGYAVTLLGRRRPLPELKDSKAQIREFGKRAAMNTPIQGTAADIIKLAMIRVDRALREKNMKSRLILQVHDELILECPPEETEQAEEVLREAMEGAVSLKVPLTAEVHTGSNWAETK